ncbi:cytochrome P450 [Hyphomonas sp.]|uniref:cytochrome P450 n=1 Tax=Hyphomonas sp. TaxID=87 RepID=UPI0032EB1050
MANDTSTVKVPQGIIEISAFVPEARNDPHTPLKALRDGCPVMRDDMAKTWLLTRYDDVRGLVNDRGHVRLPSKAEEGSLPRRFVDDENDRSRTSILFLDDPDHARIRQPLARAFYARINRMKPDIEAIIDDTIAAAPDTGSFDLMEAVAVPVPVLVIARILGVDERMLADFRQWSEDVILGLNPVRTEEETARLASGAQALDAYFTDLMNARRIQPRDDLISDMVMLQASGEADITDDELILNLQALLVGGNLTTTDLIGNGVWLFLTHPEQLAALKDNPGLGAQAVEEVLRYEAPVSATSRILAEDQQIAGCPMKARQAVFCSLASANRDESTFEAADRFDITVKRAGHVAFGGGPHICIGAPLARIEARRVYQKLFERYPDMRLAEQEIVWRALPFFRGIERLDVEV